MSAAAAPTTLQNSAIQTNPHPSTVDPFPEPAGDASTPRAVAEEHDDGGKKKKRTLFGFGKKKAESSQAGPAVAPSSAPRDPPSRRTTASPAPADGRMPASPRRTLSTSPRLSPHLGSPAGSQIFERDVQEAAVALPTSPAIPSHITTEDFIPSVLDASSEAITDDRIDPDSVEIVTHTSHQPAVAAVVAGQQLQLQLQQSSPSSFYDQGAAAASWAEQLASFEHAGAAANNNNDSASNYGSLDTTDVRRLSFISFADVVQAEHGHPTSPSVAASRDSMHLAGLTSLNALGGGRSPSPIRSPVSSQGGGMSSSPPTSKSGSVRGLETSPTRKPAGVPLSPGSPPQGLVHADGELKIETMSQALRRTGSTDLSGVRSLPHSPIEGPSR